MPHACPSIYLIYLPLYIVPAASDPHRLATSKNPLLVRHNFTFKAMTSQDAHSKPVQDATADAPAIVIREPTDPHPGDKHEIPDYETHGTFDSLKDRIKLHYNVASDYYYSLW